MVWLMIPIFEVIKKPNNLYTFSKTNSLWGIALVFWVSKKGTLQSQKVEAILAKADKNQGCINLLRCCSRNAPKLTEIDLQFCNIRVLTVKIIISTIEWLIK